jgi:hypothetical protein
VKPARLHPRANTRSRRDGRVVRRRSAKPYTWVQFPFAPPIPANSTPEVRQKTVRATPTPSPVCSDAYKRQPYPRLPHSAHEPAWFRWKHLSLSATGFRNSHESQKDPALRAPRYGGQAGGARRAPGGTEARTALPSPSERPVFALRCYAAAGWSPAGSAGFQGLSLTQPLLGIDRLAWRDPLIPPNVSTDVGFSLRRGRSGRGS